MKNRLNNTIKWVLFLIAYYPLFLILLIKNSSLLDRLIGLNFSSFTFKELNDPIIYGVGIGIIFLILIKFFIKFQTNSNTMQYKIISFKDVSHETLNYVLTYIIGFLSLNLCNLKDILCILILLSVIGIIYINSNLLYINPVLQLFGFSIYKLNVSKNNSDICNTIIAIAKTNSFNLNEYIHISLINEGSENIYFVK